MRFAHHHPGGSTLAVSHDPHLCGQCKQGRHDLCGPARCFIRDDAPTPCVCTHQEVPA